MADNLNKEINLCYYFPMKILLAASEVAPFIKIGGLGDVAGSLPKALQQAGANIDVIVPFFPSAKLEGSHVYKSMEINVPFDGEIHTVEVHKTKLPRTDVDVILLKNSHFFTSGGVHFYQKSISETQMFSFFNRAIVEYIKSSFNTYDLIHCNDWHTGLITHILSDELGSERPATLFTIHNLMYQGIGDSGVVKEIGLVPGEHPLIDWDISDGDLNMVQQGVLSADFVNAVSPTYAKEILTPEFGGELSESLKAREGRLTGILNGIDYSAFPREYNQQTWKEGKRVAKEKLQAQLGLSASKDRPVFSFVGRLDPNQKGLDILFESLPALLELGAQFVLIGSGDKSWEEKFEALSNDEKVGQQVKCALKFDVDLANLIYSASDFIVIPSKYEPCGLIQMIAMWYGTLPIVHGVGGLKDSVINEKTGFVFDSYTSKDLTQSLKKAVELYNKDRKTFDHLVENALDQDFSWKKSAIEYLRLYEKIIMLKS